MASSSTESPTLSSVGKDDTTTNTTTSVAILIGSNATNHGKQAASSAAASSATTSTIPVVVWMCQERGARQSPTDPWKYTLEYFEFLEDTTRWTHLDQLLLRYPPQQSLHLGDATATSSGSGSGNGSSSTKQQDVSSSATKAKQKRRERLVENLQVFLEERSWSSTTSTAAFDSSDNPSDNDTTAKSSFHWHTTVPSSDPTSTNAGLDAIVSQLLLQEPDVQLAHRGNLQLAQGKLLQQGLLLWLQGQGLWSSRGTTSSSTTVVLPDPWLHSCKIQPGRIASHLVMDRTAASCIHLLPPPNQGVASVVGGQFHTNSLFGLLSQPCSTGMGRAKLQAWLRQPLIDLDAILYRQRAVTALVQSVGKDSLKEALRAFAGVDLTQLAITLSQYGHVSSSEDDDSSSTIAKKIIDTTKPLKALYQLYVLSSKHLPQLLEGMESFDKSQSALLQDAHVQLTQLVAELDRCQGLVETVLDLDMAPREFLVQPSYSTELQDLYRDLQQLQDEVQDELQTMQEAWAQTSGDAKTQIRLETFTVNSNGGESSTSSWQFRLPNTNDAKVVEQCMSGIQLHRVLKNGVYFSTSKLRGLSAQHQQLSQEYSSHSQQVVQQAMQVAYTYVTVVERAAQVLSTLDVITALARVAAYSPHGYCAPILTDVDVDSEDHADAGIELQAARHPCVELQDDMEFIPNDVSLRLGADSQRNFTLVTGPNMGGKSTYIRALGAVVCLAQIGAYVPADAAKINLCHSLLARVGAGDLQERGISTFMAEMLEASSILRTATSRSLIIIDELGRGTSTFDGYGLARAISEYLQQRIGCMTVFATHFHELTRMPGVTNCHVTAVSNDQSGGGLTFLYQVRPGPCLESFGIQVAEMANVPAVVIADAKRKAAELEHFGNDSSSGGRNNKRERSDSEWLQRFQSMDVPRLLRNHQGGRLDEAELRRQLQQQLQ